MKGLGILILVIGGFVTLIVAWPLGLGLCVVGLLMLLVTGSSATVCPKCGNRVSKTANLCPTCQAVLVPTEGALAPKTQATPKIELAAGPSTKVVIFMVLALALVIGAALLFIR